MLVLAVLCGLVAAYLVYRKPSAEPRPVPAAPARGESVVVEDFSEAGLPDGWKAVEGDWKVEDGRLVGVPDADGRPNRIVFGRHLTDFRLETTVRFAEAGGPGGAAPWVALGLDVPASGTAPWAAGLLRGGAAPGFLEFARRTPGREAWDVTDKSVLPAAVGADRDVRLAVEVRGTRARWFFDGREALRTTRVSRTADGGQALLVDGARVSFDDVRVAKVTENALLRPPGSPMAVIGHRGASSAAPENTLMSDEVARRGGAEWIENDVQPSKDGVPYVLHDPEVDRTTDGAGLIRSLTAAEVDALDAGSWFGPAYAGARVPTLAAQLDDLRKRGGNMLLEIKGRHSRAEVARIVEEVRDHGMTDRVVVQSFDVDALKHTRELAPELPLGLLRAKLDPDPVAVARELGLSAYNPLATELLARPDVVKDLHAAGVAVMVWTVDDAAHWSALEPLGTDGVITNRPAELSGWNAGRLHSPR
ncbi:glycerophosphodiester phosphodiesterase [Streptomyces sp. NPDC055632]